MHIHPDGQVIKVIEMMELKPVLGIVHISVEIFSSSACIIKLKNALKLQIKCIAYVMLLQQAFYSW